QLDWSQISWSTLRDWGTAYPLAYMEDAHEHGERYGVSPFLVQAIIRQESGFRPEVRSPAGAIGLMQLMPQTAAYVQRLFLDAHEKVSRRDLKKPQKNVHLGSMYIRLHTAYAADSIPLALAGYNAGPAHLKRWHETYGDRDLDAWVESITFTEARGYVRKVMTSFFVYAHLYGGALPKLSLKLPKELRGWGDVPELKRVRQKS
ncbi:MAG: lytic transglycosylase domain-containing protein, partial [Myxococcota bacterium]